MFVDRLKKILTYLHINVCKTHDKYYCSDNTTNLYTFEFDYVSTLFCFLVLLGYHLLVTITSQYILAPLPNKLKLPPRR